MGGSRYYRHYTVTDAFYIDTAGVKRKIAGVPEYGTDYFGDYHGDYPYIAATKAFTGLQKHMKKFHQQREEPWFPNYDPEDPPVIRFLIQDTEGGKQYAYQGRRVRAPQSQAGPRMVAGDGGRVREYNWANEITPLKLDDVAK